jgi:dihydroxyacetone kinase DhaKLM complex PTS-EIIA-like component DhaM
MAGPEVRIEPAGGLPNGGLGTDEDRVRAAIRAADQGAGVVVLGDLGSAILTVRHVLERHNGNGNIRLVDAPIVEGAVAAAVTASANLALDDVVRSAEEARGAGKL